MRDRSLGAFRIAAVAEAVSWSGLLIGMFFKYVVVHNEIGVKIFGPIHGGLFICYVIAVLVAARAHRWSLGLTTLGLLASVPPLLTLWFERTIRLREAAARGQDATEPAIAGQPS